MKQYQIRWSIEVFFKDCKQNLHLNSCQSTDFDANITHVSIVFMNYMILSLRNGYTGDDVPPFPVMMCR